MLHTHHEQKYKIDKWHKHEYWIVAIYKVDRLADLMGKFAYCHWMYLHLHNQVMKSQIATSIFWIKHVN